MAISSVSGSRRGGSEEQMQVSETGPARPLVLLLLAEGFEDLEAAAIRSACGWTKYRRHVSTVGVVTTGLRETVRGRFGAVVRPDLPVGQVHASQYVALAIPGGFHSHGFDEAYDPRVRELARAIHRQGGVVATMCVGILPVAEAGLLVGRKATCYPYSSSHDNLSRLAELGAVPDAGPIVVDDRIISCAGPAQALEVATRMLELIIGSGPAAEIRRYMLGGAPPPQHFHCGRPSGSSGSVGL